MTKTRLPILPVEMRWMVERDMPFIHHIERSVFDVPWTEEEFREQLRNRDCIGTVAEAGNTITAYMVYLLHLRSIELLSIAVDPALHRRRIGAQMVLKLRDKLNPQRRRKLTCTVSDRNKGAHLFLHKMGFKAVKVLRRKFGESDGYRFEMGCEP